MLERVGLSAVEQGFVVSEADPLPPDLLAYLRLLHLGPPSTPSDAFLLEAPTPPLQLGTTTARPRHAHDMPTTCPRHVHVHGMSTAHLPISPHISPQALFADDLWREHLQQPVSRQNEAAALQLGHDAVTSALGKLRGDVQLDLASLAEAPRESVGYRCAAVRYAERRAVSAAANELRAALGSLDGLEYYQERRLKLLNLTPVETEEELEALRSAGRRTSDSSSYDW